jgi:predicted PurR-regulated permease PerM
MGIIGWFIVILYIIFIMLDYEKLMNGFKKMIPSQYRRTVLSIGHDVKTSMNLYFRGQSLVALSVGILFSIGFLIIGLPMAVVLGMFIGLLNMVPYLQLVALVPTILLSLLKAADSGSNFWYILAGALLVFCIVQAIQDTIIVPKIMGKITGLNPAIILLSLSIWGALMGIVGMIIALPCTTIILSYYKRYIKKREGEESINTNL